MEFSIRIFGEDGTEEGTTDGGKRRTEERKSPEIRKNKIKGRMKELFSV